MTKRITVYQVAMDEGFKRKAIIARAGHMLIQELRRQEKDGVITNKDQEETWGKETKTFSVACYPAELKPAIVGYLQISQKLQRISDVNKRKDSTGQPGRG